MRHLCIDAAAISQLLAQQDRLVTERCPGFADEAQVSE
jgi:hypothetical protein